jgi:acetolactate synthase-1/2/3 large subunit
MVRQWQTLFYGRRYASTVIDDGVDYIKLAESMGARAYKVTKKEEFVPAFREALKSDVPVLIDVIIDEDDKVFPMVAPGANIDEAFDENDLMKKARD